jgi:hypothetical protein
VTAYAALLCDPYPPFSGAEDAGYPIRLGFAGPLERYSRATTAFRAIRAIPILILRYILTLRLAMGALVAWVLILITGAMPLSLFELMAQFTSYVARSDAYLLLLTETYPPFEEGLD